MALLQAFTLGVPDPVSSSAYEKSKVIKNAPGVLFSVDVFNKGAADAYLMLFDGVSLPANGTVPVALALAPKGVASGLDFGLRGRKFSTGIVAALSTSAASLQIIGSDDAHFSAQIEP